MMNRTQGQILLFVISALAATVHAVTPVVTSDLLRVRSVRSIEVSWDGSFAILAIRSISEADDAEATSPWRNESHLWRIDLKHDARDGSSPLRQLTFGLRVDTSPRLSPDARSVAFVRREAERPENGEQIWILPLDGGEARPVTAFEKGVSAPRWAPDGQQLVVTASVPWSEIEGEPEWSSERPARAWPEAEPSENGSPDGSREEIRAWLAQNAAQADPSVIVRPDFQGELALKKAWAPSQVMLVEVNAVAPTATALTNAHYDHRDAVFTPDGQSVLFVAPTRTGRHPDRSMQTTIWRIPRAGGVARELAPVDGWALTRPSPSRDGSVVAVIARPIREPAFENSRLALLPVTADGASAPVWFSEPATVDGDVYDFAWLASGTSVAFTTARRGGFPLMTMGLGLLEPATLAEEQDGLPIGVWALGTGGGSIVYSVTSFDNPCVVRVRDARGDRLVADLNSWVRDREISRPRPGRVQRPDGVEVDYWLMEPARLDPERTYPLVLQIHGGPSAMWGPGEFTMWHEFQLLCSWGFGVVYANPRGSGGYGESFLRGSFQNWGDGPAGDVLAAVDDTLAQPWVDAERLVITGGSYGGYLTAWVVAHDHRFKAAVAQRGVYDLETFYGEGNAWRLVEWSMGGRPSDARTRTVLDRESPFTHASRIRTPLLIMHGSQDLRTGVSQSEMLYRVLKAMDRPVEYVRYPNAGHDLSRSGAPHQRMDRLNRIIEFFERYVENRQPAPRTSE